MTVGGTAAESYAFESHGLDPTCAFPVVEENAVHGSGSVPVACTYGRPGGGYDIPRTYLFYTQCGVFVALRVSWKSMAAFHSLGTPPRLSTAWGLGLTPKISVSYWCVPSFSADKRRTEQQCSHRYFPCDHYHGVHSSCQPLRAVVLTTGPYNREE